MSVSSALVAERPASLTWLQPIIAPPLETSPSAPRKEARERKFAILPRYARKQHGQATSPGILRSVATCDLATALVVSMQHGPLRRVGERGNCASALVSQGSSGAETTQNRMEHPRRAG